MKSFDEVQRIKNELEPALIHLTGVTGITIESGKRYSSADDDWLIVVYVEDKNEADRNQMIPVETQGVSVITVQRRFGIMSNSS